MGQSPRTNEMKIEWENLSFLFAISGREDFLIARLQRKLWHNAHCTPAIVSRRDYAYIIIRGYCDKKNGDQKTWETTAVDIIN